VRELGAGDVRMLRRYRPEYFSFPILHVMRHAAEAASAPRGHRQSVESVPGGVRGRPQSPVAAVIVAAIFLAVGVALRLRQFAYGRPLWLDELFVALGIVPRTFADLTQPQAWDQATPVLFAWLVRLSVLTFGVGEQALRVPSLLAGCVALPLLWYVGGRLGGRQAAAIAVALAALSPHLVYYSNELKPYMMDGTVALALAALTLRVIDRPEARGRWLALVAAGELALPLSSPALFMLAAIGVALLTAPSVRRARRGLLWVVAAGTLWVATFAGVYLLFLRHVASDEFLHEWFSDAFLNPTKPGFPARLSQAFGQLALPPLYGPRDAFPFSARLLVSLIVVGLGALGVGVLWRRAGVPGLALVTVPLLAAIAASAVERYPLVARTMLFAAPFTILAVASGATALAGVAPGALGAGAGWLVGGALAAPAAIVSARQVASPVLRQNSPPIISYVQRHAAPDDAVYITRRARPAWAFYTTDWTAPDARRLAWLDDAGETRVPERQWAQAAYRDRMPDPFARARGRGVEIVQHFPVNWVSPSARTAPALPLDDWAASETRRMRASGRHSVWMVSVDPSRAADSTLVAAVRAAGGSAVTVMRGVGVDLYRFTFPSQGLRSSTSTSSVAPPRQGVGGSPHGGARRAADRL